MTWAIKTDGDPDYLSTQTITLTANTSFEIEFLYSYDGSTFGRVFGNSTDYTSRCLLRHDSQVVLITDENGVSASYTAPTYTRSDFNKFRFTRDAVGSCDFYLNDVLVGSVTGFTGGFNVNRLLSQFTTTSAAPSKLQWMKFSSNGVLLRNFDATLSNHSAGTVILSDIENNSDATGVNMPTDGSAWVDLGGSTPLDITPSLSVHPSYLL